MRGRQAKTSGADELADTTQQQHCSQQHWELLGQKRRAEYPFPSSAGHWLPVPIPKMDCPPSIRSSQDSPAPALQGTDVETLHSQALVGALVPGLQLWHCGLSGSGPDHSQWETILGAMDTSAHGAGTWLFPVRLRSQWYSTHPLHLLSFGQSSETFCIFILASSMATL